MPTTPWIVKTFEQLTVQTLYDILKLRIDIFVVEQTCYYPDLDGLDCRPDTLHIYAYQQEALVGYLRCLAPNVVYDNQSAIGRVVVAPCARGQKLGHSLLQQGIAACEQAWPQQAIHLSAQFHLQSYYQRHGFHSVSEMYLEDDIPHIGMLREVNYRP